MPYADLIEDGGSPVLGVRGVMFLNAEGVAETRWDFEAPQVWVGTALGLLESMKHGLLHDAEDE